MINQETITFHQTLEIIESFPDEQQEDIIEIIQKRLIERKRDILAKNIQQAKEEYEKGETKEGTIDELMKELNDEKIDLG